MKTNSIHPWLFALLVLPLLGGTAKAQVPVLFKISKGVRPNAMVSLYGEYLTGTPSVHFLKSDGSVAATQPSVQTDQTPISLDH